MICVSDMQLNIKCTLQYEIYFLKLLFVQCEICHSYVNCAHHNKRIGQIKSFDAEFLEAPIGLGPAKEMRNNV